MKLAVAVGLLLLRAILVHAEVDDLVRSLRIFMEYTSAIVDMKCTGTSTEQEISGET